VKTYCVPVEPDCVVATAMVCDPCVRLSVRGAICAAPPSTLNCKPDGLVRKVMFVGDDVLMTMSVLELSEPRRPRRASVRFTAALPGPLMLPPLSVREPVDV